MKQQKTKRGKRTKAHMANNPQAYEPRNNSTDQMECRPLKKTKTVGDPRYIEGQTFLHRSSMVQTNGILYYEIAKGCLNGKKCN
jgi:hypothetical protein